MSEFSRMVDPRQVTTAPLKLVANAEECAALAVRFALVKVEWLDAEVALERDGHAVKASGRLQAAIIQPCAVSGEDLSVTIDEQISLRFVPEGPAPAPGEEVELTEAELDEIPYAGSQFDLGEAVAQGLGLAIDPYLTGPQAEEARRKAGIVDQAASGPFAALAALRPK